MCPAAEPTAAPAALRLVVADDHPIWREAVERDLTAAGLAVVGTAGDGDKAVRVCAGGGRARRGGRVDGPRCGDGQREDSALQDAAAAQGVKRSTGHRVRHSRRAGGGRAGEEGKRHGGDEEGETEAAMVIVSLPEQNAVPD